PGTNRTFLLTLDEADRGPATLRAFDDRPDVAESEVLKHFDHQVLGFAFHPQYQDNGYLFVHANGPQSAEVKQDKIVRYTIDRNAPHGIVEDSELVILAWDSNGHN